MITKTTKNQAKPKKFSRKQLESVKANLIVNIPLRTLSVINLKSSLSHWK